MAAAGRVAIGAVVGAAAAALFFEGLDSGARFRAVPEGSTVDQPAEPEPTVQATFVSGTLVSATSAASPTTSTTTTSLTSTTTTTTTTTSAPPVVTTTTTTTEPPPPPPETTTTRRTTTTTTTTRRPCGILWCP
ncbi:hypothetical protein [Actinokineospora sp. UTMC 2448]|uniref:hypothetical protein n=1 Tax=Actinokineospora sp. UTMC 2448 TaxID=2268449 RepID=UPI0021648F67|nr:hypothetical protein [Actinokineospora sp. UTMC 2448]